MHVLAINLGKCTLLTWHGLDMPVNFQRSKVLFSSSEANFFRLRHFKMAQSNLWSCLRLNSLLNELMKMKLPTL